jgi:iron complex transport system substrate-binding protein
MIAALSGRIFRARALQLLAGGLVAFICSSSHAEPFSVTDAGGRQVVINDASRIVSIGGAITEILYALGRDRQIVAVDATSIYPQRALREKPDVGYMRQLSPEGVLSLRPSLILAIEGTGPKEAINVIDAAGIPMVAVADKYTGAGVIEKVRIVASAVGAQEQGQCLAAAVSSELAVLDRMRTQVTKPVKVMFVLSMSGDRLMVAGRDTAADGIIKMAGAVNAMTGYNGYKAVNDEAVIAAAPDVILAMQRGRQVLSADEVFSHSAFRMTPAAAQRALVSLDGLYMLGFGPRTALAAGDLAAAFYPHLADTKLPASGEFAAEQRCRG